MTERRSRTALAREIYADVMEQEGLNGTTVASNKTPLPNPPPQGGREQSLPVAPVTETRETALTARVRKLYEESALPIREIARIAGVTERTIYKYAAKNHWKPRYLWNDEGTRPQGRPWMRGAGWQARGALAPAKGAGGRFIAREDRGNPVATGLKATDPEAAARAAAECTAAALREHDAYVSAVKFRHGKERDRVWRRINNALGAVERHRVRMCDAAVRNHFGRRAHHPGEREAFRQRDMQQRAKHGELNDRSERSLWAEVRTALEQLHVLREEQDRTLADLDAQRPSGTS